MQLRPQFNETVWHLNFILATQKKELVVRIFEPVSTADLFESILRKGFLFLEPSDSYVHAIMEEIDK